MSRRRREGLPSDGRVHCLSRSLARWAFGFVVVASVLGAPLAAEAGLRFQTERIEFRVEPDQEHMEAQFDFVNDGNKPVRIESVQTDCTCLKAEAPEGEIPPGGRGVVSAEFVVGSLRGTVEKHLSVQVRDGKVMRRIRLDAVLVVPEVVRVEPRTLSWTLGGELREQSFRVRMSGPDKVRLLKVVASRPNFVFRVETLAAGREYLVHAKPLSMDGPLIALVNFTTDSRHRNGQAAVGFVHVGREADQNLPHR